MTKSYDGLEICEKMLLDMLKTALTLPIKSGKTDAFLVEQEVKNAVSARGIDRVGESVDWEKLVRCADRHGVLSLIADELKFIPDIPDSVLRYSMNKAKTIVLQNNRLLELSAYYIRLLESRQITAILLKGAGTASLYPIGELRKSGDIDILITDGEQFDMALNILKAEGLNRVDEQHANYHEEMRGDNGIIVELHHSLAEQFDDARVNRMLKIYTQDMGNHVVLKNLNGKKIYCLEDAWDALSLVIHMLHHFLRAGFGLKLLCDWTVFWNRDIPAEQKKIFGEMIETLGITGFVVAVNIICTERLGMDPSKVDFMMKSDARVDTTAFLKDIIEAEEFGDANNNRMVAMRGTGIRDYFREFHHQMRINNPSVSQNKLLWPYLWIKTLVVFIRNNRRVRNTTISGILKSAGKRSRLTKEMKLFTK